MSLCCRQDLDLTKYTAESPESPFPLWSNKLSVLKAIPQKLKANSYFPRKGLGAGQ